MGPAPTRRPAGRAPRRRAPPARCRATRTGACGTGCAGRQRRAPARRRVPARTAAAPAAARRPGATAGAARPHGRWRGRRARRARSGPGAAPGACRPRRRGLRGASSASMSPLRSKKSTPRSFWPHCDSAAGAIGQRAQAHRLVHAGHRAAAVGTLGIAAEHAADFEHAHAAGAARQVVVQHAEQAAHQAGAHHRQRRGDRVEHADRVAVAGQLLLPALFDEAVVDGFLVVQRGHRVAHRMRRCAAIRSACARGSAPPAACRAAAGSRRCAPPPRSGLPRSAGRSASSAASR